MRPHGAARPARTGIQNDAPMRLPTLGQGRGLAKNRLRCTALGGLRPSQCLNPAQKEETTAGNAAGNAGDQMAGGTRNTGNHLPYSFRRRFLGISVNVSGCRTRRPGAPFASLSKRCDGPRVGRREGEARPEPATRCYAICRLNGFARMANPLLSDTIPPHRLIQPST